jgi:tetratricopeptide (TPR) repeat protein
MICVFHFLRLRSLFVPVVLLHLLAGCGGASKVQSGPSSKDVLTPVQRADVTHTFINANKEKMLGNLNEAVALFSEVIRKDPQNAAAMFELSNVYMQQKKYADALFFSKSAYKLDPGNVWYAQQYAEVLQRNSRFKEASEVLERMVSGHPDEEDYYHQLAQAYVFGGDPDAALKTYDRLEARFGIDQEVSMNKCRIYQQVNKPDRAIEEMKRLIAHDSTDVQAYGMLAELYQSVGDNANALKTYQRIEEIDPDNPFISLSLADFYRTAGEKEKSFAELKKAVANPQLDIDTKISILSSYYSLVEMYPELKEQAMDLSNILVATHPTDPRPHAARADFLALDKKYEDARAEYRRARELGSREYSVFSQSLLIDSQLQDWDAMLKDSEEALGLFPDQPLVYFFNGLAKSHAKRYSEAITVLKSGVNMVVDNPQLESSFYSTMGEAYHELGDYAKSDASYDHALLLDPKDATLMNNYAYFLSLRGDRLTKAEELSRRSNELEPDQSSFEDTYGWIMFVMGRYQESKTWIGKAMQHGADSSAVVLEHYGDVLYKLGDFSGALEYWQKAKAAGEGASEQLDQKILQKKYIE